jgi:hypothetical protein
LSLDADPGEALHGEIALGQFHLRR